MGRRTWAALAVRMGRPVAWKSRQASSQSRPQKAISRRAGDSTSATTSASARSSLLPGCPRRPDDLLEGIMRLQDKIRHQSRAKTAMTKAKEAALA